MDKEINILLVEDDFALAMGTEYALQAEGYKVLTACNLQEARNLIEKNVSLVLLDMPILRTFSRCYKRHPHRS